MNLIMQVCERVAFIQELAPEDPKREIELISRLGNASLTREDRAAVQSVRNDIAFRHGPRPVHRPPVQPVPLVSRSRHALQPRASAKAIPQRPRDDIAREGFERRMAARAAVRADPPVLPEEAQARPRIQNRNAQVEVREKAQPRQDRRKSVKWVVKSTLDLDDDSSFRDHVKQDVGEELMKVNGVKPLVVDAQSVPSIYVNCKFCEAKRRYSLVQNGTAIRMFGHESDNERCVVIREDFGDHTCAESEYLQKGKKRKLCRSLSSQHGQPSALREDFINDENV